MKPAQLRHTLAGGVLAIAVFTALAGLSEPRPSHRPSLALVATWVVLLATHAAAYWWAERLRGRLGDATYVAIQAGLVFAVGMSGALFPAAVALYIALTTFTVIIAESRWGAVPITFGAIALFALNAILTANLYFGATAGLLLVAAGLAGHAISALLRRSAPAAAGVVAPPVTPSPTDSLGLDLTPREMEVLEALMSGASNGEIAARFGISERTVKAHLGHIYAKLGVDSRTAAIAAVTGRRQPRR